MKTLHFNGTMTVADVKREFNTLFGAQVRLYDGNKVASLNAYLSSIGLKHNGEMKCQGEAKVADFAKQVLNEFGIKLKVYTCDEWAAVLDDMTLEMAGRVKKSAVKADMEKMLANEQTVTNTNNGNIGGYKVVEKDDGGYSVYKDGVLCDNAKGAMREIAALIDFEVDPAWTTRQLGAKLLKALQNGAYNAPQTVANQNIEQTIEDDNEEEDENIWLEEMEDIETEEICYTCYEDGTADAFYLNEDFDGDKLIIPEKITSDKGNTYTVNYFDLSDGSYSYLSLPSSLTSISGSSFSENENISIDNIDFNGNEKIIVEDGLIYMKGVNGLFLANVQLNKPKGEYTVKEGVEDLRTSTFCNCEDLKVLILPDSVKHIYGGFCEGCDNLEKVIVLNDESAIECEGDEGATTLSKCVPEGVKVEFRGKTENIPPTPSTDGRTEIVLNKMFSGSYLDDNIGHEIINLYKDDNGENYVYIQPYGTYSASHYNAVKYVMFVRTIEGHFSEEVLGVAEICADEYNPNYSEQSIKEHQEVLCDEIKYGGHSLTEIFSDNGVNVRQLVSVSMKARRVRLLDRKVYLVFEPEKNAAALRSIVPSDSIIIEMQTNYAKSSMKQYFEVGDADYKNLKELIENRPEIWTKESESIHITDQVSQKEESFWDICRIDDYELAYSNALAYYMKKYPELVVRFAKERLGIETHSFGTNIQRELANVDIYMENDERIVVIENKITSKINGINVKDKSSTGSQLDKYYRYAMERAGGKKDVHCYLLSPNYNHINLQDYSFEGFDCEKMYKPLYYSDIYDFLQSLPDHPYKDFYFREYIKGIEKHTKQYHDDLFEETRRKFVKKLQSLE